MKYPRVGKLPQLRELLMHKNTNTVVVFLCIASMYWWERSRGAGWGDSVGFLVTALEGFSWSPAATQHFLYANLSALSVRLFSAIDPVTVLTAMSILFAILTLVQVYRTGIALTEDRFAALLGTVAFAFSFTFWRQVEQIEVYTLASFCTASAFRAIFTDIMHDSSTHLLSAGIWMGLAFLVHIQTVLLMPFYSTYLLQTGRRNVRMAGASLCTALAGPGILIAIATISPAYTINMVFFNDSFHDEIFTVSIPVILKGAAVSVAYTCYAFHIHLVAILIGLFIINRTAIKLLIHVLVSIAPVWFFAMRYPVTDQYVFFLNAYLILTLVGITGYNAIFTRFTDRTIRTLVLLAALVLPYAIYETASRTALLVPQLEEFHARKAYKGGLTYFLRPGLRTSPDLFELVRQQQTTTKPLVTIDTELWDRLQYNTNRYWELLDKQDR